jgi:hypothetical protein
MAKDPFESHLKKSKLNTKGSKTLNRKDKPKSEKSLKEMEAELAAKEAKRNADQEASLKETAKKPKKKPFENRVSGNGGTKTNKKTPPTKTNKEKVKITPKPDPKKEAAKKEAEAKTKWLKKTRNSPAAKSKNSRGKPTFSDNERWELQKRHRAWKEARKNRKKNTRTTTKESRKSWATMTKAQRKRARR